MSGCRWAWCRREHLTGCHEGDFDTFDVGPLAVEVTLAQTDDASGPGDPVVRLVVSEGDDDTVTDLHPGVAGELGRILLAGDPRNRFGWTLVAAAAELRRCRIAWCEVTHAEDDGWQTHSREFGPLAGPGRLSAVVMQSECNGHLQEPFVRLHYRVAPGRGRVMEGRLLEISPQLAGDFADILDGLAPGSMGELAEMLARISNMVT